MAGWPIVGGAGRRFSAVGRLERRRWRCRGAPMPPVRGGWGSGRSTRRARRVVPRRVGAGGARWSSRPCHSRGGSGAGGRGRRSGRGRASCCRRGPAGPSASSSPSATTTPSTSSTSVAFSTTPPARSNGTSRSSGSTPRRSAASTKPPTRSATSSTRSTPRSTSSKPHCASSRELWCCPQSRGWQVTRPTRTR